VAAYRFKAEGHVTMLVYEIPYYTLLTTIIRPTESSVVTYNNLLQAWGRSTQIRAFRLSVWFSQ